MRGPSTRQDVLIAMTRYHHTTLSITRAGWLRNSATVSLHFMTATSPPRQRLTKQANEAKATPAMAARAALWESPPC
jgi:hypothetical protein